MVVIADSAKAITATPGSCLGTSAPRHLYLKPDRHTRHHEGVAVAYVVDSTD